MMMVSIFLGKYGMAVHVVTAFFLRFDDRVHDMMLREFLPKRRF